MTSSDKNPYSFFSHAAGLLALVCACNIAVLAAGQAQPPPQEAPPRVNADAAVLADFNKRVEAYVALHNKVDGMLTEPSKDGRPEAVVEHQRAFAKLMQQERQHAQAGDIMTKPMRDIVRRLLASVFRGPNGRDIKHAILDEYTGNPGLRVNQAYPDNMPFSSVPFAILEGLPKLPDALAYRFVGSRLILLDPHGRLVVDVMEKAFP
jgi:hypothetical protein